MVKPKLTLIERLDSLLYTMADGYDWSKEEDYIVLRKALAALDMYEAEWNELLAKGDQDMWENEGGSVHPLKDNPSTIFGDDWH